MACLLPHWTPLVPVRAIAGMSAALMAGQHAVPEHVVCNAAGKMALVLDLGSCTIETDTALAASLPSDEAALYECIKLQIKDVSAYAVDGEFSFQALEDASAAKAEQVSLSHVHWTMLGIIAASVARDGLPSMSLSHVRDSKLLKSACAATLLFYMCVGLNQNVRQPDAASLRYPQQCMQAMPYLPLASECDMLSTCAASCPGLAQHGRGGARGRRPGAGGRCAVHTPAAALWHGGLGAGRTLSRPGATGLARRAVGPKPALPSQPRPRAAHHAHHPGRRSR